MTRIALVSSALALLAAVSGCERQPTNAPEAPVAEKTDFSPPEEEYGVAGEGSGPAVGGGEEETAPGLSSR